jgi:nucleoid-associated protein YgaU
MRTEDLRWPGGEQEKSYKREWWLNNWVIYPGTILSFSLIIGLGGYFGEIDRNKRHDEMLNQAYVVSEVHTVEKGETLFGISRRVLKNCERLRGIDWEVVSENIRKNNGIEGDRIVSGQTLTLPSCYK